jgi:hypothetical protein
MKMSTVEYVALISDLVTGVVVETEGAISPTPGRQIYRGFICIHLRLENFPSGTNPPSLATMPVWLYHSRPTSMAFRNLTTIMKPTNNLRSLTGLNLKSVPNPRRNFPWAAFKKVILPQFYRDLRVKVFVTGVEEDPENPYNPKMYAPSDLIPPNISTQ